MFKFILNKPSDRNTSEYNFLHKEMIRIQVFHNIMHKSIDSLDNYHEGKVEDWDGNYDLQTFLTPMFKAFHNTDELRENLDSIKMNYNLKQDKYFTYEQLLTIEFLQIFSSYENYILKIYRKMCMVKSDIILSENKKLSIKYEDYKNMKNSSELVSAIDNIIKRTIDEIVRKVAYGNFNEIFFKIIKLLSDDNRGDCQRELNETLPDINNSLFFYAKLRNIHIHNAGLINQEFLDYFDDEFKSQMLVMLGQNLRVGGYFLISSMYNQYRENILKSVEILDKYIYKETETVT